KAGRATTDTTDGVATTYGYDLSSELTNANAAGYSYDGTGNRTMSGYQTGADNRLLNDGTNTYTYDNANELTGKSQTATTPAWSYAYDARSEMTSAVEYASPGGAVSFSATYTYDVYSRLIAEAQWSASTGVVTTHFGMDGWNAWATLTGANALQTRYVRPDG